MWWNPWITPDWVTFTEEIYNGKLQFLCGVIIKCTSTKSEFFHVRLSCRKKYSNYVTVMLYLHPIFVPWKTGMQVSVISASCFAACFKTKQVAACFGSCFITKHVAAYFVMNNAAVCFATCFGIIFRRDSKQLKWIICLLKVNNRKKRNKV